MIDDDFANFARKQLRKAELEFSRIKASTLPFVLEEAQHHLDVQRRIAHRWINKIPYNSEIDK